MYRQRRRPRTMTVAPTAHAPTAHIVGGGPMGLMAALELSRLARRFELPLQIAVYEASAFGGGCDDFATSPRCQAWLHTQGPLYALRQPEVSLSLQRSVRRLAQLAPTAFRHPLAIMIVRPTEQPLAEECFRLLGIDHTAVSPALFANWFPTTRLRAGCQRFRVNDGTIDLRLLAAELARQARRCGVQLHRRRVARRHVSHGRAAGLTFADGDETSVGEADMVVLACGARIRGLLATADLALPGLRLFKSHLVASDAVGIRGQLIVLGGSNCVPHVTIDGRLMNLFGDIGRSELEPEQDNHPIDSDPQAVGRLIATVADELNVQIPPGYVSWPAVKTELVIKGNGSQVHHALRLPELRNTYLAIPGKLSQSAACAIDLAILAVREQLGAEFARSCWEEPDVAADIPNIAQRVAA